MLRRVGYALLNWLVEQCAETIVLMIAIRSSALMEIPLLLWGFYLFEGGIPIIGPFIEAFIGV